MAREVADDEENILMDYNQQQFLELVRAGLFPNTATRLIMHGSPVDWSAVYRLAEEQSVMGLVAASIDILPLSERPPQEVVLQFVGCTLQLEHRNKAMNEFVASLIELLRKNDIYALLVKGQGIAQSYEKPLWRACGDVDLLLNANNYDKAKQVLLPLALDSEDEYKTFKHLGMTMKGGFVVELHGTMHSRLSRRVDRVIDEAQKDVFFGGNVRSWLNGRTTVFLPALDDDVIFVITHILHHYYLEGIGLRQICDWCRLLWKYRTDIDIKLLEKRLRNAGLITEWKAFAALAVDWLGMPVEAMPLYSSEKKWSRKADGILAFVLECGNFGHNRKASRGKISSVWSKTKDFARHSMVFPLDSVKFYFHFLWDGLKLAAGK